MHHPLLRRLFTPLKYSTILFACVFLSQITHAQGFIRFYPETTEAIQLREIAGGYKLLGRPAPGIFWTWYQTDIDGRQNAAPEHFPTNSDNFYMHPLENGDFLATDYQYDDTVVVVRRQDPAGSLLWEYHFSLGESNEAVTDAVGGVQVRESNNGDLYLKGHFEDEFDLTIDAFVFKLNAEGQFVWSDTFNSPEFFPQYAPYIDVNPLEDNGALILYVAYNNTATQLDDDNTITRKDAFGQDLAEFDVPFFYYSYGRTYTGALPDGRIFQFIADPFPNGPYSNIRLRTYNNDGDVLTEANITNLFQSVLNDDPALSVSYPLLTQDGNFILPLSTQQTLPKNIMVKITPEGQVLWQQELLPLSNKSTLFQGGKEFSDGTIGFIGLWSPLTEPADRLMFVKLGPDGNIFPYNLNGIAARDENENCMVDLAEPGLQGWILEISQDQETWFTTTGAGGQYTLQADTGLYYLNLTAPGYLWEVCDNPQTVGIMINQGSSEYQTDFSVEALADCPFMQVDIASPYLLAGENNTYFVQYCNLGTSTAADVVVSIEPNPALELVSASIPYNISNGLLEFQVGQVAAGTCGNFSILFAAADNPDLYGQSICVTAHIRPDSICLPGFEGWSGAILEARGVCDDDSIRFEVKNIGLSPSTPSLEYIIADDHVIMYEGYLPAIAPNDLLTFAAPATGVAWRFRSEQEPNAPAGEMPSVQVEGCATNGAVISKGLAVQTPNQTGSPFSDTECLILFNGGQAPTLSADPVGIPPQNLIEFSTEIEYLVQFQSKSIVNQVVIKDTLPADLDLSTFAAGPSSHPYSWSIGADGAVYFYLSDQENGLQEGFVQFAIKPKTTTPDGTVITNQAILYFDQLEPKLTNTVFHTIGQDTVSATYAPDTNPIETLGISPNPASESVLVTLPFVPEAGTTLLLQNALGQLLWEKPVSTSSIRIPRGSLPTGLYWLECREKGKVVATGKMVWR